MGYIKYVISRKQAETKSGKIKKLAGAIADAIVNMYLSEDYKKASTPVLTVTQKKSVYPPSTPLNVDPSKVVTIEQASAMFEEDRSKGATKAVRLEVYLKALHANGWVITQH